MTKTKSAIVSLTLISSILFIITILALPVQAENNSVQTIVLSDEGPGLGRTALTNAGYGDYSPYQALVQIQRNSDPSLASILTPSFLNEIASLPSSSPIFSTNLWNYSTLGTSIAISTDGTVQTVSIKGSTYYNAQGSTSLDAVVSGVMGTFRAVYSSTQAPLTTFTANGTTYNVFGILYMTPTTTASTTPTSHPTPTTPELQPIPLLPLALMMLFAVAIVKYKRTANSSTKNY
jgi:hypothetical protein